MSNASDRKGLRRVIDLELALVRIRGGSDRGKGV